VETVLITGASSGIGEALAGEFAGGGYELVLVARSREKLRSLAGRLEEKHQVQVGVEVVDLSRSGAAARLAKKLQEREQAIDILVNSAGVLEHGRFCDIPASTHRDLINLNVSGLTDMISQFLPGMLQRGSGRILNVASIAAFQPVPSLATYAATKAYVLSLTESLAEELAGTGVSVTALCPGLTATNMISSAQRKSGGLTIPDFLIGEAGDVARQGYRACLKGDVICIPGAVNLAATLGGRVFPKSLVRRLSGVMGRYTLRKP
jgi:short-subunit dehydrogenase